MKSKQPVKREKSFSSNVSSCEVEINNLNKRLNYRCNKRKEGEVKKNNKKENEPKSKSVSSCEFHINNNNEINNHRCKKVRKIKLK